MKQTLFRPLTLATLWITALLLALPSWASGTGGESSGGGNAVVCFDDPSIPTTILNAKGTTEGQILDSHLSHITLVEALDLHEAKYRKGLDGSIVHDVVPIHVGETPQQYATRIEKRYGQVAPLIPEITWRGGYRFDGENVIRSPYGLAKIDDTRSVTTIDPVHCVLATIAVQQKMGEKDLLTLDSRLYDHSKHSDLSKGVILLHEHIYRHARELGQTDSARTRAVVRMIIRNHNLTYGEVIDTLYHAGFGRKVGSGFGLDLNFRDLSYPHQVVMKKIFYPMFGLAIKIVRLYDKAAEPILSKSQEIDLSDKQRRISHCHHHRCHDVTLQASCGSLDECKDWLFHLSVVDLNRKNKKRVQSLKKEVNSLVKARDAEIAASLKSFFEKKATGIIDELPYISQNVKKTIKEDLDPRIRYSVEQWSRWDISDGNLPESEDPATWWKTRLLWVAEKGEVVTGKVTGPDDIGTIFAGGTPEGRETFQEHMKRMYMYNWNIDRELVPALQ